MNYSPLKLTLFIFVTVLFISCSPEVDGIYFDNEVIEAKAEYCEMDLEIIELVNDYRISKGLNSLEPMNIVSSVAKTHTTYMVTTGIVGHDNFSERYEKLVHDAHATEVGENVGYGYRSSQAVVNAWINSEGHRANIENPDYTHFGISTETNIEGRNFFTQIFIKR